MTRNFEIYKHEHLSTTWYYWRLGSTTYDTSRTPHNCCVGMYFLNEHSNLLLSAECSFSEDAASIKRAVGLTCIYIAPRRAHKGCFAIFRFLFGLSTAGLADILIMYYILEEHIPVPMGTRGTREVA